MRNTMMAIALSVVILSGGVLIAPEPIHAMQKTAGQKAAGQRAAGQTIKVKVKGLFCDLCRTKMQKSFGKIAGVQKVNVNLESGFVTIRMDKGKSIPNKTINKIIRDTGYTPISINRS